MYFALLSFMPKRKSVMSNRLFRQRTTHIINSPIISWITVASCICHVFITAVYDRMNISHIGRIAWFLSWYVVCGSSASVLKYIYNAERINFSWHISHAVLGMYFSSFGISCLINSV